MAHTYARFAGVVRTVHIYLTMSAFLLMMFFAVTGVVLNHEDWIAGQTVTRDTTATVPAALLALAIQAGFDLLERAWQFPGRG